MIYNVEFNTISSAHVSGFAIPRILHSQVPLELDVLTQTLTITHSRELQTLGMVRHSQGPLFVEMVSRYHFLIAFLMY